LLEIVAGGFKAHPLSLWERARVRVLFALQHLFMTFSKKTI